MNRTSPSTRCRRKSCGRTFAEHNTINEVCPDLQGAFMRLPPSLTRVSDSFNDREVDTMLEVCRALLAGGDVRHLVKMRAREIGALQHKAGSMKRRLVAKKEVTT